MAVDDNHPAGHFLHGKPAGEEQGEGVPVVSEEGRQVPGVARMRAAVRIVVGHGVRERVLRTAAAAVSAVDVEAEDALPAGEPAPWEAAYLGADDHALIGLKEPHRARQAGIVPAAGHGGRRLGPAAQDGKKPEFGGTAGG